jgi:hypothetical protein
MGPSFIVFVPGVGGLLHSLAVPNFPGSHTETVIDVSGLHIERPAKAAP